MPNGCAGPRIHLTDYSNFDSNGFKMIDLFRYQTTLMERMIREDDNAVISGTIEIIDMSKMSLSFVAQMDFSLIKKMGVFADKGTPIRLKGVHLVNCPKEAVAVLNLGRSLMPAKLQSRVSIKSTFNKVSNLFLCLLYSFSNYRKKYFEMY